MRRATAVDANQKEIVHILRQLGCSVACTHTVGDGYPDLSCGIMGIDFLVEVKDGAKVKSARKLTEDEIVFHRDWKGRRVCIIETVDEAIALVKIIRSEANKLLQKGL